MIKHVIAILSTLTAALWFGGLLMLFVAVSSLFAHNDRVIAGKMASDVFSGFEGCQLFVAAALLICLMCWLTTRRDALKVLMLLLAALATAIAIYNTVKVSPELNGLRLSALTGTQRFKTLHGLSMALYFSQAVVLGILTALLPPTIIRDARHEHVEQRTLAV